MKKYHKMLWIWMILLCIGTLIHPAVTSAHASIVKSTPSDNEVLSQSPSKVTLQFNESLQPAFHSIQVTDSSGERVNLGESKIPAGESSVLEVDLQPDLPQGIYSVQWKAVSGDGHPVEGTIPFQVGEGSGGSASHVVYSGYTPGADLVIVRWLFYLSLAMLTGILCFYLYLLPAKGTHFPDLSSRGRKLLGASYAALAISVLLSLPMQTTIEAGVSWVEVWNTELLSKMLRITSFGHIWLVQVILLLLLGALIYAASQMKKRVEARALYMLTFYTGIAFALSKAFIGHAASTESRALPVFMDFLHLGAVSIWLGCLLAIAALLPREASLPADPGERKKSYFAVIQRFSLWGTSLIAAIIISGIYATLKYVPTWYSLFHTAYGQILLIKCLLLLVMLGFATFNLIKGQRGKKHLGSSVCAELGAGIITLVLAALLTNLPTATSAPGPVDLKQSLENQNVISLHISPNITGNNHFEVEVKDAKGQDVQDIQQIKLTLTSMDMDMGKYDIVIPGDSAKPYKAEDLISMAGRWNVHVHVLTASLEAWDADFKITVGNN